MIASAVRKTERTICVCNEKGRMCCVLHGRPEVYTATTVSVRPGPQYRTICVCDEKGHAGNTLMNV